MGRGKRNPGCGCCGEGQTGCTMFETEFAQPDTSVHSEINDDLDVTAGTWEIQSERLVPTSTNARIVYTGNKRNKQQSLRIKAMRGADGDIVNVYARWTDATDNVRIEITYGTASSTIKVFVNGSQLGDDYTAYDIVADTDHPFHWSAFSEVTSGTVTKTINFEGYRAEGDWVGWFSTNAAVDFKHDPNGATDPTNQSSPYDSQSYDFVQDSSVADRDGALFAIGSGSQADDIQISNIGLFEPDVWEYDTTTQRYTLAPCTYNTFCSHVGWHTNADAFGGEPHVNDSNATVDAGWVNSIGGGVEAAAGKTFLYKHDLPRGTDCRFTITYEVDTDSYDDGVEFIFDYVDSNNYKFWRSKTYTRYINGRITRNEQIRQYGEVLAGVTRKTQEATIGTTKKAGEANLLSLSQTFSYEINPDSYCYLPFYTANQGGTQVGFRTLSGNSHTVKVTSFGVLHGARADDTDATTSVCLNTRGAPTNELACTDGKRERSYTVTVSGHPTPANNGTWTYLTYDAVEGNHQYWSADPRLDLPPSSRPTVYELYSEYGAPVTTSYVYAETPGCLWRVAGLVNCQGFSATSLTLVTGDPSASATITAVV